MVTRNRARDLVRSNPIIALPRWPPWCRASWSCGDTSLIDWPGEPRLSAPRRACRMPALVQVAQPVLASSDSPQLT